MIRITNGNLLGAKAEALVNTVNTVGVMGKGIALQFKRAYPDNFKAYAKAAKAGQVQIGRMFVFERGLVDLPHYIINFPTKEHWRGPSKLEYIESGLEDLVRVIRERQIRSVAMPALGSSNGGLSWDKVRPLIERALGGLEGVEVLLFEPHPEGKAMLLKAASEDPGLTPARAALLKLFALYGAIGDSLGRLETQKIAYFLNELYPIKLKFERATYGPYADALNHVLLKLDGHYLEGYGDRNRPSEMYVRPGVLEDVEAYLGDQPELNEAVRRVARLIEGYESPYAMELLATLHWVVSRGEARDFEAAFRAMQGWSERKRMVFDRGHAHVAWQRLVDEGWVSAPLVGR